MVEGCRDTRLLADHRADLRAAGDGNIGTASGSPGNVARELDYVAIALVGNQQQSAIRQRCAVPLRAIRRRQELRRVGEPKAPFVFLPATEKIAAQQRRLGNPEMRSGKFSVQGQCALRAVDRFVELKPVVVQNPEIMITMWIARCKTDRAVIGGERVVVPLILYDRLSKTVRSRPSLSMCATSRRGLWRACPEQVRDPPTFIHSPRVRALRGARTGCCASRQGLKRPLRAIASESFDRTGGAIAAGLRDAVIYPARGMPRRSFLPWPTL